MDIILYFLNKMIWIQDEKTVFVVDFVCRFKMKNTEHVLFNMNCVQLI